MAPPEKFHGLMLQCDNFFVHQRDIYIKETTKCTFLLSLLTGRALDWASTIWDNEPQMKTSFAYLSCLIRANGWTRANSTRLHPGVSRRVTALGETLNVQGGGSYLCPCLILKVNFKSNIVLCSRISFGLSSSGLWSGRKPH